MLGIGLDQAVLAYVALAILVGMFTLFVRETYPVEVTAIGAACLMLVLGILPQDDAVRSLSNAAPWTIAAMFIIAGGLVRTGALDSATQYALRYVKTRPKSSLVVISLGVIGMSAFMNNTPIVVVMIPVFMQIARQLA
ncbi:MAG: SLC13 family permease, partial [Paracoccaceae bacterium]